MGKKYIIELEDKPLANIETPFGDEVWRVKGFKSLVFDKNGLDKLEEFEEKWDFDTVYDGAYQSGLNDAWQTVLEMAELSALNRNQLFGIANIGDAIRSTTPKEAIRKLTEYDEKKGTLSLMLKVGDEVEWTSEEEIGVVTTVDNEHFSVLYPSGDSYWFSFSDDIDSFKLTGRRFTQMAEVMSMIGDNNDTNNNCWE